MAVAGAARSVQRVTPVESYRVYSEHYGAGDPVVLLHGLSGSQRWWRYTVPALAREYEVHVLDLVGHGRSRRAPRQPTIPEMAALVRAWIERIGIDRPHLVGHSMGGQIAIHIAAGDLALRSLTLVDAAGLPRRVTLREITRFMAGVLPPRAWGVPHFIPTIWLDAMRAGPRSLLRAGLHILNDDVTPLLPRIRVPTLVVWGALDPLLPMEHGRRIADAILGARFVVFEDAAHNVMCDRPAEFNQLLLDFLAGV